MAEPQQPDEQRAATRDAWERSAPGWGAAADRIRTWGMGVSTAMIDALALHPGERVVELAAGPGDTGFMAAELIAPGGTLICSDGAEAMLDVARERASAQGVDNVEFRQLELEWIDLPTADVDAVLSRWGIMLVVDPAAAAREIRRILKPGGRAAIAVWDRPERNPWTTLPRGVMVDLGHAPPPDPDAPGMFSLSADGALRGLLEDGGLVEVTVTAVAMERTFATVDALLVETVEMSATLRSAFEGLDDAQRATVRERLATAAVSYTGDDGTVTVPGSTLVARASA